jgi:hypothetical protein
VTAGTPDRQRRHQHQWLSTVLTVLTVLTVPAGSAYAAAGSATGLGRSTNAPA